ncbi:MAG TPA: HD domain-containing phosphohydrolase [Verrucomicrobiae bacterium]
MSTSTANNTSPHRILIVDDEEIVMVGLRETLTRAGYQVKTSSNPLPALELLQQEQFAVIISDHQMPQMTGLEFLALAKQIQPDATRILITAVLSLDTVIDAINKGEIYRFIVKPWLREELLATVKNAAQRFDLLCKNALLQATTLAMNDKLTQLNRELEARVKQVDEQNQRLAVLNEALQTNLFRSVELCLHTMESFYPTLGSQGRRVHDICDAIGHSLNFPPEQQQAFEISAWLHDIGLVSVPRQIIRKWQTEPHKLNESDKAIIRQHPILGQELARFVHDLEIVGLIIRSHHERFDGQGYPDMLQGEQIPWSARLLAVAVGYADSIYLTDKDALEAVKLGSGKAYDPEAVRAFLRALPDAQIPARQREVLLSELRPGMVLARGIYTPSGILLIPEGQQLNGPSIDKLLNHNQINPISQSLVVYC